MNILNLEEQRKLAVLNAALKEFAAKGYDDASTNVIAKDAGISKALMFHYVNSKQELFLFVYDYFAQLLSEEYYTKMDFSEADVFSRLRQSYLLQIDLIKMYPWIFDFNKLSALTRSDDINQALASRVNRKQVSCDSQIFKRIDCSKFRAGLDIEQCKKFIFWSNVGFTNEILEAVRNSKDQSIDYEQIILTIDEYLSGLKKIFYRSGEEEKE